MRGKAYSLSALLLVVTASCFVASFLETTQKQGPTPARLEVKTMPFRDELPSPHGTARRVSDPLAQTWNRMVEEIQRVLATHELDAKLNSINHSAESHSLHMDLTDRETGTSYQRVFTFRPSEDGGYLAQATVSIGDAGPGHQSNRELELLIKVPAIPIDTN